LARGRTNATLSKLATEPAVAIDCSTVATLAAVGTISSRSVRGQHAVAALTSVAADASVTAGQSVAALAAVAADSAVTAGVAISTIAAGPRVASMPAAVYGCALITAVAAVAALLALATGFRLRADSTIASVAAGSTFASAIIARVSSEAVSAVSAFAAVAARSVCSGGSALASVTTISSRRSIQVASSALASIAAMPANGIRRSVGVQPRSSVSTFAAREATVSAPTALAEPTRNSTVASGAALQSSDTISTRAANSAVADAAADRGGGATVTASTGGNRRVSASGRNSRTALTAISALAALAASTGAAVFPGASISAVAARSATGPGVTALPACTVRLRRQRLRVPPAALATVSGVVRIVDATILTGRSVRSGGRPICTIRPLGFPTCGHRKCGDPDRRYQTTCAPIQSHQMSFLVHPEPFVSNATYAFAPFASVPSWGKGGVLLKDASSRLPLVEASTSCAFKISSHASDGEGGLRR